MKAMHMKWFGRQRTKRKETISWKVLCLRAFRAYHRMVLEKANPFEILCWACVCGHHVVLSKVLR